MRQKLTLTLLILAFFVGMAACSFSGSDQAMYINPETPLVVENVRAYDMDGRLAFQGRMDLEPELARIERGESDPHRNDGSIFQNRERRLPIQERGYYREYVVRTPGIRHAGPQRLVIGQAGEVYYTADHYESFLRIR